MIPEWLSFSNELFPSPHRFMYMYLFKWYHNEISFSYKSFRNELIPLFSPNEILFLVQNFILVLCKLKTNFRLVFFLKNRKIYFKKSRSVFKSWRFGASGAYLKCALVMFLNRVFRQEWFNRFPWFLKTFEISAYV